MAEQTDDKKQLVAELSRARERFDREMRSFRRSADFPARLRGSIKRQKGGWLFGSLLTGWIISRLPVRKKKVKVYLDANQNRVKKLEKTGLLLATFKLLAMLAKPTIMAYATKRITDIAQRTRS